MFRGRLSGDQLVSFLMGGSMQQVAGVSHNESLTITGLALIGGRRNEVLKQVADEAVEVILRLVRLAVSSLLSRTYDRGERHSC